MILAKKLAIEIAPTNAGEGRRVFGLYPPTLSEGSFVYPRYLGVALYLRFAAPGMTKGFEKHSVLSLYPPGKEDSVEVTGSPYRIVISLAQPDDGSDPYETGRMIFQFKLLKGKDVLFTGSSPSGGEVARDGYHISFPDSRRLVVTDFIQDNGVLSIWAAIILFVAAGGIWLPIRLFLPRREMLFSCTQDVLHAYSRAEGKVRMHGGVFHEALDFLEARSPDKLTNKG
jgi:hypothetical protein